MDNILLIQELMKNDHKNGGIPRGAIKMDLMEAYDLVGWAFFVCGHYDYIMAFPSMFIQWVKSCVSSPMF